METCKSPRTVMRAAYELARRCLPDYSCKSSRHDFTLAQLFACLVVRELMKLSYRRAEALLRDCDSWCTDIGLSKVPDHNTLCNAHKTILGKKRSDQLLDMLSTWADDARMLKLSTEPLAVDSTSYESHHVSRHYERRCLQTRKRMRAKDAEKGRSRTRSRTIRSLPKLAISVATGCHFIASAWTGTGAGADHPNLEPLVFDAWRRVHNRRFKVVGDAGYDSEKSHELLRDEMGLTSLIPAEIGQRLKPGSLPQGRWRRRMKRTLATKDSRKRSGYTSRWQVETVNSMMKRNLGSALRGKTAHSRKRDMRLKTIVHDLMIV